MKKLYNVLLAISVYSFSFSQVSDITRLPVQSPSQSIKESSPIVVSNNEILMFSVSPSKDTIFLTRTTNGGQQWSTPSVVDTIQPYNEQTPIYITSVRTNNGRIILGWSILNDGMYTIFSDDNGISWSQPQRILGVYFNLKSSRNLNLISLDENRILLCFNDNLAKGIFYKVSYDFGTNWEDDVFIVTKIASGNYHTFEDLSITQLSENMLLAVYVSDYSGSIGIYKKLSTDDGVTWGDSVKIVDTEFTEYRPRLLRNAINELWLLYQRPDTITYLIKDYSIYSREKIQNDIYFLKSTNLGESWIEERFTKYIGDDAYINTTLFDDHPFVSFTTERFGSTYQIAYAILGISIEQYTPPFIFYVYVTNLSGSKEEVEVFTTVLDDDEVESVKVHMTDSTTTELFDDGEHNDEEAGDNIYGNSIELEKFDINTTSAILNANKIWLPFNTQGVLADVAHKIIFGEGIIAEDIDDNASLYQQSLYAAHPTLGKYDESGFLFSGGFYVSGYSNGTLWANAVATVSIMENYLPGRVNEDPDDPRNLIYIVNSTDRPFGIRWQQWKDAVRLGADFYDGDKDGIYNPVDKNWNGIWDPTEDMPDLLGDQTAWCVYNDGETDRIRFADVDPQGIEIQQTLFASGLPELENVVFIRYKIFNRGTVAEILDSVYFAFWSDPDLGVHSDDLVGCDTTLSSAICYNDSGDYAYGENPPAFFTTLLQGPVKPSSNPNDIGYDRKGPQIGSEEFTGYENQGITAFIHYRNSDPFLGDPWDEREARNYMLGIHRLGFEIDPCDWSQGGIFGGIDCNSINRKFWYSGDPVEMIGWINTIATDHRSMLSTGPFKLEKDKPISIIGAFVLGRGTDALNSITVARENVKRAILECESNFASLTYEPGEPVYPVTAYILYHNYPNPFNPTTTIRYELPQDGIVTIKLYDILGQEVATILNEFQKADRYEVKFDAGGLASGVYIYRMKVNDFITSKKMLLIR